MQATVQFELREFLARDEIFTKILSTSQRQQCWMKRVTRFVLNLRRLGSKLSPRAKSLEFTLTNRLQKHPTVSTFRASAYSEIEDLPNDLKSLGLDLAMVSKHRNVVATSKSVLPTLLNFPQLNNFAGATEVRSANPASTKSVQTLA